MLSLRRRREEQLQRRSAEIAEDNPADHFGIAPRVPDAMRPARRPPQEAEELPPVNARNRIGETGPERGDTKAEPRLQRNELDDRRRDARQPALEVRGDDLDFANAPHDLARRLNPFT